MMLKIERHPEPAYRFSLPLLFQLTAFSCLVAWLIPNQTPLTIVGMFALWTTLVAAQYFARLETLVCGLRFESTRTHAIHITDFLGRVSFGLWLVFLIFLMFAKFSELPADIVMQKASPGQRHVCAKRRVLVTRRVSEGFFATRSLAYASGY